MSSSDVSQALSSSLVETADFSKNSPVSNLHEYIDQLFAGSDRDFLRSAISREEGRFLAELASRPHVRNTVEIAAGASSCQAGASFLHPVDAHRPRTIQLGVKFLF